MCPIYCVVRAGQGHNIPGARDLLRCRNEQKPIARVERLTDIVAELMGTDIAAGGHSTFKGPVSSPRKSTQELDPRNLGAEGASGEPRPRLL